MSPTAQNHTVRSYDEDLAELTGKIVAMGGLVEAQLHDAMDAMFRRDDETAERVVERDREIDLLEEQIDQMAVKLLATRQPMAVDLRLITMSLKISNSLERMGDHAKNNAKRVAEVAGLTQPRMPTILPRMTEIVQHMIKDVLDAYVQRDAERAMAVWHRDQEIDGLYRSLERELLTYMLEDPRNITPCLELYLVAKNLERIGDQATNIAEKVHYVVHGRGINVAPDGRRAA